MGEAEQQAMVKILAELLPKQTPNEFVCLAALREMRYLLVVVNICHYLFVRSFVDELECELECCESKGELM